MRELRPTYRFLEKTLLAAVMVSVLATPPMLLGGDFLRGDANRDTTVNIADVVTTLNALFASGAWFTCEDAADGNDDGVINIADPVQMLGFLFDGQTMPSPGARFPGPDPTSDALFCEDTSPEVLISEINYNPRDSARDQQFVEIHNRTSKEIDIGGYSFTRGISYVFGEATIIPPEGFVVVAKDPSAIFAPTGEVLGPFSGELANGGEALTLRDDFGFVIESFEYDDLPPWPTGPDGFGGSLERVNYFAPPSDPHTWRGHPRRRTTPGATNAAFGTPLYPILVDVSFDPAHPTSNDEVTIRVKLDVSPSTIQSAFIKWETSQTTTIGGDPIEAEILPGPLGHSIVQAVLPAQPSQRLVRSQSVITLQDSTELEFPHPGELIPLFHYFVYDHEILHSIPLLWAFPVQSSTVTRTTTSGAIILEPGSTEPRVFGRARINFRYDNNGFKVKFMKGNEYHGDRTINILPEEGGGGGGKKAPHMEHLAFRLFRQLGALAPRTDWFRVIDYTVRPPTHTQNVSVQQINERFFAMNGLSGNADIYKIESCCLSKQNNLTSGDERLSELLAGLTNEATRRETLASMDLAGLSLYSALAVLISHWDSFHNNHFLYDDRFTDDRWRIVFWDADQAFQETCTNLPIDRPVNGLGGCEPRVPRKVITAFHSQPDLHANYRATLKALIEPGGPFVLEDVKAQMTEIEQQLLDDLVLQEQSIGRERPARRSQIVESYASFKRYLDARIPFLLSELDS